MPDPALPSRLPRFRWARPALLVLILAAVAGSTAFWDRAP